MATPTRPDDIPRDEHLRAALRHAPDADLQPPPHLRAQIVAAAHRALAERPAAAPVRPRPWWRPGPLGASGALASVLLAGVIGLMWQDGPPGPALDGPADAVSTAPPPAAMGSASATSVMPEMVRGEPPAQGLPTPPAPLAKAGPAPAATATPSARPAAPSTPAAPAAPAAEALAKRALPESAPQRPAEAPLAAAESPRPQPSADLPPPAPAAPPPAPPPAAVIAEPVSPPSAPRAPATADFAPQPAPLPLPAAAAPPAAAGPALALGRQAAAARLEAARARAAGSAASGAAPLRWRIDGIDRGTAAPFWLQLAIARDRQSGQPSPLERLPAARFVELIDAAGAVDRLWLDDTQLLWCPADRSGCRLTPLAPAEAEALRRALPAPTEADQTPKRDSR